MRLKKGFTIVEMLMVIAILAVLTGLITTAATSAIRNARKNKADAAKTMIQAGIATYYAQNDYWPPKSGELNKLARDGDTEGKTAVYLSEKEYDVVMSELAAISAGKNAASPVIDLTGLQVATKSAASRKNGTGLEYREAVKQNRAHGKTISLGDMVFGYAEPKTGYFKRFVIKYNIAADSVEVLKQDEASGWSSSGGNVKED